MLTKLNTYLNRKDKAIKLSTFRIFFGILMFISLLRFWYKGWIESLYTDPPFHFTYYGFIWVKPYGNFIYLIFVICIISSILITIGYKYKLAIIMFFLSFTYIELIDKTTYLNHYYFVSVLSLLLIFIPCNNYFSIDSYKAKKEYKYVYKWQIDVIKILIFIVYFYAGLAKINTDWLFNAMPLKIWMTSKYDIPLIGKLFSQYNWFHYAMSWIGMLYDLIIPFLLFSKKFRNIAFLFVVIFHLMTSLLFPIGMFPYIMIFSTLIFFETTFHERIVKFLKRLIKIKEVSSDQIEHVKSYNKISLYIITVFLFIQIIFPFRYLLYPGELFWTEEGYRFSWRVMLMEKMGYTTFKVVDPIKKTSFIVNNSDFLTPFQEKQMSFQPDFILEYAHHLGEHFISQGHSKDIEIYVDSYVALNGRRSQKFIDSSVNLLKEKDSFKPKTWILPFKDEIKGF